MIYSLAADLVILLHLLFIIFVIAGGLLAIRWYWSPLLHLPAFAWAALLELNSWVCPLTPLENHLRSLAGEQGYAGGFIEHYLLPVIYPSGLTSGDQLLLGVILIVMNILVYAYVLLRRVSRAG